MTAAAPTEADLCLGHRWIETAWEHGRVVRLAAWDAMTGGYTIMLYEAAPGHPGLPPARRGP
jgi:hypothetical protein